MNLTRLIPARAGNISFSHPSQGGGSAHPRSRGEHRPHERSFAPRLGSSPLARGTYGRVSFLLRDVRLIPARAGNISTSETRAAVRKAHPRSRGEHPFTANADSGEGGSSPLARGTFTLQENTEAAKRLIPARAGNMMRASSMRARNSAHPRSRGEHFVGCCPISSLHGSSPLARGTFKKPLNFFGDNRLIPARAGNIAVGCL